MAVSSEKTLAAGIPVFQRTNALKHCLESLQNSVVEHIIIADNGHTDDRTSLYEQDWTFELTVLDLDYDAGIGRCRAAIVDKLEEDHLLVMDNDMTIPSIDHLDILQRVLDARPDLGGIGATLVEGNRLRYGCTNLHEEDLLFGNKAIVHDIRTEPEIEWVEEEIPVVEFDKIAQAAIIRKDCLAEYSWDPRLPVMEHLDFFLNHYHNSDWNFAITPNAVFNHHKNIDQEYRMRIRSSGREYQKKKKQALSLFEKKWGYHCMEYGHKPFWIDSKNVSTLETGYHVTQRYIPLKYLLPVKDIIQRLS